MRTAADWLLAAVGSRPAVHLGLVPARAVPLDTDAPELAHHD
jgi:NADH dehydrogenase